MCVFTVLLLIPRTLLKPIGLHDEAEKLENAAARSRLGRLFLEIRGGPFWLLQNYNEGLGLEYEVGSGGCCMSVSIIGRPFCGCPYHKCPTIWGLYEGPSFLGTSRVVLRTTGRAEEPAWIIKM